MNTQVTTTNKYNHPKAFRNAILMYFLLLSTFSITNSANAAEGIFIYRQTPAHAFVVMEYNSFKKWEATTVFRTSRGVVEVTKFQPLQILPYINPQANGAEIRIRSIEHWRQVLNTYKSVLNTYPKSKVYLAGQVAQLETIVTKLSSGNAWFEGKWVKDSSIAEIRAKRRADKKEQAKRENIKLHNQAIKVKIAEKRKLLSTIQNDIENLTNQITSNRKKIHDMNKNNERDKSALNAEISRLLKHIK